MLEVRNFGKCRTIGGDRCNTIGGGCGRRPAAIGKLALRKRGCWGCASGAV